MTFNDLLWFSRYYSKAEEGRLSSQISHTDFNDLNMEEESRYISHAGKCHFLGQSQIRQNSFLSDLLKYFQLIWRMMPCLSCSPATRPTPTGRWKQTSSSSTQPSHILSSEPSTCLEWAGNLQNTTDISFSNGSVLGDWCHQRTRGHG